MSRKSNQAGWPGDDERTALPCGDNRYIFAGGPDRQHLEIHCAKCPSRWGYLSPKLDGVRWLMVVFPPKRHHDSYGFLRAGAAPRIAPGQTAAFETEEGRPKPTAKTSAKPSAKTSAKGRGKR